MSFFLRRKGLRKAVFVLLTFCIAFFQLSCAARINGSLAEDGSASIFLNISLEPRITSLIRTFQEAGGQEEGLVLDGAAISQSMAAAPGIESVSLKNISPSSLEGTVNISKINEFLSAAGLEDTGKRFISFEQGAGGGRCGININLENGPLILEMFSPEAASYLNALMAPIATGEELNKSEYLDLVTSVYNKTISDEIAASRVCASIEFPGAVKSVSGGTFNGKTADFDIALLDLLVLETPLALEALWD